MESGEGASLGKMNDISPPAQTMSPEGSSPFGDMTKLTEFIGKTKQEVDYGKMISSETRVLSFGEVHYREAAKEEVISNLKVLKELGFTHIGMEVFGEDVQESLDQSTDIKSHSQLIEQAKRSGRYSPGATDLYLTIAQEAKNIGLQIIGLNLPSNHEQLSEVAEAVRQLDTQMAARAKSVLEKNPQNRIVTFTGAGHAEKGGHSMAEILQQDFEVVGVNLTGGGKEAFSPTERAALQAQVSLERFMVPNMAQFPTSSFRFDWVVHLPQVEEPGPYEQMLIKNRNFMKTVEAQTLIANTISRTRKGRGL